MPSSRCRVDFEPLGNRVEINKGMSLLDAARAAGIPLKAECGGVGFCGKCRVVIHNPDTVDEISQKETKLFSEEDLHAGYRLACQTIVCKDTKVEVPPVSLTSQQRLQMEYRDNDFLLHEQFSDLNVKNYTVQVTAATLQDLRSDLTRVLDALASQFNLRDLTVSSRSVKSLSGILRKNNWQVKVLVRDNEITGFLEPDTQPLGFAVDLGTTKIAAYLLDLSTGKTLGAEGRPNPQIVYGEDVISRMVYATKNLDGAAVLAKVVRHTLNELASELASHAGQEVSQIVEVCVVGNTAMIHLFMGLPVQQLLTAPYISNTTLPQDALARDIDLHFSNDCRLYIPAMVAGYVGADLVSMTLASRIGQDHRTVLGLDIGTNTEIVLSIKNSNRMYSVSCASGPAFEGAHIHAGMRASAGAIEGVMIQNGTPIVKTIGNVSPVGICGSGIIDAIAELYKNAIINSIGRLQTNQPGVRMGEKGWEYLLVPAAETQNKIDLVITQQDIEEIQLAKGAILAGITVLLDAAKIQKDDLDEIIVAGAFGSYLNLDSSIALGLFPDIPISRFQQVGNAAGAGAKEILVSRSMRLKSNEIADRIDYIELTTYPGFRRIFARAMLFNEKESSERVIANG